MNTGGWDSPADDLGPCDFLSVPCLALSVLKFSCSSPPNLSYQSSMCQRYYLSPRQRLRNDALSLVICWLQGLCFWIVSCLCSFFFSLPKTHQSFHPNFVFYKSIHTISKRYINVLPSSSVHSTMSFYFFSLFIAVVSLHTAEQLVKGYCQLPTAIPRRVILQLRHNESPSPQPPDAH